MTAKLQSGLNGERSLKSRKFKPCVSAFTMGNVCPWQIQWMNWKCKPGLQQYREYRKSSIKCFTEMWLHKLIPDSEAITGHLEAYFVFQLSSKSDFFYLVQSHLDKLQKSPKPI